MDPQTNLIRMASAFTPIAVRVTATLRLADHVDEGTTDLDALSVKTNCDKQALGRLMRYLCLIELFLETSPQTYALTDTGRVLCSGYPAGPRRWLDLDDDGRPIEVRLEGAMAHLLTAVQTGRPVYEQAYGRTFWEDLAQDEALAASFDDGLANHARKFAPEVGKVHDWASVRHVVDVGGGTGALLAELLSQHPQLRGTLFDLGITTAKATSIVDAVADRCELVGGSFFDPLPAGADAYLIANTLHNWSDTDAVRILRRCAEAVEAGGRVLVVERMLDSAKEPIYASYADLLMLVVLGARERDIADFEEIGARAGLTLADTKRLAHPGLWLIEYALA